MQARELCINQPTRAEGSRTVGDAGERRQVHRTQLSRSLRERIAAANRASSAEWAKVNSREEWEAFRQEKLAALRKSLGILATCVKEAPEFGSRKRHKKTA